MTEEKKYLHTRQRKDKYFMIGPWVFHYIHYYPQKWSTRHWGFQTSSWKNFSIDFYFGRHVIVWDFRRWS